MLTATLKILKEGVFVGIADESGEPWAEYYLVGKPADKVANVLIDIISFREPIRGDRRTLRQYVKRGKKGKK
jgi:hypothetical protein